MSNLWTKAGHLLEGARILGRRSIAAWKALPQPLRAWIKGAEVAVVTAAVTSLVAIPATDFTSKASMAKAAAGVAATVYGALRLYLASSPIQDVIVTTKQTEKVSTPSGSIEASSSTSVTK